MYYLNQAIGGGTSVRDSAYNRKFTVIYVTLLPRQGKSVFYSFFHRVHYK